MKDRQTKRNIPVLTDVVSLGPLASENTTSSGKTPAATTPDSIPTEDSTKQHTADTQAHQLVEQAMPLIMPELEKQARKTLLDLARKLQKHDIAS